jgi:glucose-6-phosphate 1-epimerase
LRLPAQISAVQQAGHSALRLSTHHGQAVVALHGAHVLSWRPVGQREVFWLSPACQPEPAAIRGGVPVCWPWFAKQGQGSQALQHGPVRHLTWQISAIHNCSDDAISISLEPVLQLHGDLASAGVPGVPPALRVSLRIALTDTLRQTLHTQNRASSGNHAFELSQALHSYYAVSHAERTTIAGLEGLTYTDRLRDLAQDLQSRPFVLDQACDRTYLHAAETPAPASRCYTLTDPDWQRQLVIKVEGSRSVVVWNPGHATARQMPDVPDDGWSDFICIEATNAGSDWVCLRPGEEHALSQHLQVTGLKCSAGSCSDDGAP